MTTTTTTARERAVELASAQDSTTLITSYLIMDASSTLEAAVGRSVIAQVMAARGEDTVLWQAIRDFEQ